MESKCKNCAWYCHSDSRCYGSAPAMIVGFPFAIEMQPEHEGCGSWQFDGLKDYEREDTLMTMAGEEW